MLIFMETGILILPETDEDFSREEQAG